MNFKKRVNGSWVDTPNYIHDTSTDTLTTLPADIYANAATATVGLKGQAVQSGTPTPSAPIYPSGCGEKTGNLFDENYPNISGTIRYIPLYVGEGSFTLSTTAPYDSSVANVFLLSGNVSTGASTPGNGAWLKHNVTTQSVDGYVTIAYRHYTGTTSPANCQTMLNAGSTALPYEPYGYKIPISSANTTTPVYLGEVETTRKIKKLVLTGEEIIIKAASDPVFTMQLGGSNAPLSDNAVTTLSTHYQAQNNTSGTGNVNDMSVCIRRGYSTMYIGDTRYDNITDFKAYLAAQYAAGTPVTVWYVLATEETGIVNEPLMKNGDYADEVSGITIPVTAGGDTLSVDTTVQPSEVTVNYNGWHPVSAVHERENGTWT